MWSICYAEGVENEWHGNFDFEMSWSLWSSVIVVVQVTMVVMCFVWLIQGVGGSPVPLIVQFHLLNFGLICDGGVVVVGFTVGLILIWSDSVSWMLLYLVFVFVGCVWFLRKCKESWRKFFNSPFHLKKKKNFWCRILLFFKIVGVAF